jgi:hypothetical protein
MNKTDTRCPFYTVAITPSNELEIIRTEDFENARALELCEKLGFRLFLATEKDFFHLTEEGKYYDNQKEWWVNSNILKSFKKESLIILMAQYKREFPGIFKNNVVQI